MKNIYFSLVFLMVASACKKSDSPGSGCRAEKKEYTYQAGKQIDQQPRTVADTSYEYYTFSIKDGDKNVFNFAWQFQDCPELADDEGSRVILFEMPANVNSFQLKDSADFRKAKAMLVYSCFCAPSGPVLIKKGLIEGEKKTGNVWHIKASSISPKSSINGTIGFEADFTLK